MACLPACLLSLPALVRCSCLQGLAVHLLALRCARCRRPSCSRRIDKGMAALEEMVAGFPLSSPQVRRLLLLPRTARQALPTGGPLAAPLLAGQPASRVAAAVAAPEPARAPPRWLPQDERLQELMDGMRGKFKALVAMMGLQASGGGLPGRGAAGELKLAGWGGPSTSMCSLTAHGCILRLMHAVPFRPTVHHCRRRPTRRRSSRGTAAAPAPPASSFDTHRHTGALVNRLASFLLCASLLCFRAALFLFHVSSQHT